jgi:7-cyano-7-deazaguanine synthase
MSVAVLASGGLDSSALLAEISSYSVVHPIYVRGGVAWEDEEFAALQSFILSLNSKNIKPIVTLSLSLTTLYGEHFSLSGQNVPKKEDPDAATYLPGRNIILLSLAATWCSIHNVHTIGFGILPGNPFPDASETFLQNYKNALSAGLNHQITITAPFLEKQMVKIDIIRMYHYLPLELTLTCMAPFDGKHCGKCNKCHERQKAFVSAGISDPTFYREY